jgi:hypothetical protein
MKQMWRIELPSGPIDHIGYVKIFESGCIQLQDESFNVVQTFSPVGWLSARRLQ